MVLVLIFLHVFVLMRLTESTQTQFLFQKHTPKLAWPTRLGPVWKVRSKLECLMRCLQSYPNSCYGYMYNKVNRTCVPSSGLSPNSSPPAPSDGNFYFRDSKNAYPDFINYSLLNCGTLVSTYAAYYVKTELNYTSARDTCKSMHSHLYVAKTDLKYQLFKDITDDYKSDWIGLNDMAHEGHFVWEDDGQEMTSIMKSYLFKSPQPDNDAGIENCAYKRPTNDNVDALFLNDAPCTGTNSYVCEMQP